MTFFILATQDASQEQQNAISKFLKDNEYGFWHWLTNFWIVQTENTYITAPWLRDRFKEMLPNTVNFNVFEVEPKYSKWAGWGDPKSAEWLSQNWKSPGGDSGA